MKRFVGLGEPDPAHIENGERRFSEAVRALDTHLNGKEWIAKDKLTLADLAIAAPLMALAAAKLPVGDCPNVLAWFARVQDLDAWKKTSL